ncbi:MFS transporter [Glycomyces mayteni]|uniref:MFS transporter n=1 Tax=Glycomyces mayteni TaxID=543887 RepID=A0ABW2D8C1_9ACTN|nr:MFS transporter [Glycomyces mayteni]
MTTAPPAPARRSDRLSDNPDLRNLFTAAAAAKLGAHLSYVAVPLVAIEVLGASAGEVGALAALAVAADLLFGLPAGAWVDRVRKRRLMVAADLARAALLLSVPVAWWLDALTIWQLFAAVFLAGLGTTVFEIAQQSLLPAIVDRDRLTGANGRLVALDSALTIGGRGVAGFVVALAGAPLAVLGNAIGYAWSALFVRRIGDEPAPARTRPRAADLTEGARHVWRHPALRALALSGAANNCAIQLFLTMLPLVWLDAGLSPAGLGVMLAVGGAGSLAGAAAARRLRARLGTGRSLWMIGAFAALPALCLPLTGIGMWTWAAGAAWALVGASVGVANVVGMSLRQQLTPDALLGRMNAAFRFAFMGAVALGASAAAVVGEFASPRAAIAVGAAGMAVQWTITFAARRSLTVPSGSLVE